MAYDGSKHRVMHTFEIMCRKKGGEKMPRQIEKKAFLFYASTLDILETLPEERQGKVALAIIEYGLDDYNYFADFSGSLLILSPLERVIFRSVIYEISVQKRRYHNKQLIRGAIDTTQNVIATENLDDKTKSTYIDIIKVLEERYKYVIKHDSRNVPEELKALLPITIYEPFHRRYEAKIWRDYIAETLDKKLSDKKIYLSDDDKKWIVDEFIKDFANTGQPFQRCEELIKQCTNTL